MRKGGKASTEPLAPIVLHALETYVADRTTGPIFLTTDATGRLSLRGPRPRISRASDVFHSNPVR